MGAMGDDIQQRFAAGAAALREYLLVQNQSAALKKRVAALEHELASTQAVEAQENRELERLAGFSMTSVLAALRGSRADSLERERAAAEAARYRAAEARARLDAGRHEYGLAGARMVALASAPARYAALLAEKERVLAASGDARGQRLIDLAEEHGRLTS